MRRWCHADRQRGSTVILGIGLLGLCLLACAVVVDAASAFLQHRQLFAIADAAALSGAQVIDLPSYYRQGAQQATRLDSAAVIARARAHVESLQERDALPGLRVESIRTDGSSVIVELSAPVRLAFLPLLEPGSLRVRSTARLDYRGG